MLHKGMIVLIISQAVIASRHTELTKPNFQMTWIDMVCFRQLSVLW